MSSFFSPHLIRQLTLCWILLVAGFSLQAQPGPTSQWYFGRFAAIDFNSGRPVSLPASRMDASEGCTAISDSAGNLLFYSDGLTIWTRFHQPMRGGSELQPGLETATQSALIVPQPGSRTRYYLFMVDAQAGLINTDGCGCLSWAVVDMTEDNGVGAVVDIGSRLGVVTEKLAAVTHGNGQDYWVLLHKWDTPDFLAYRLYPDSLASRPVVTRIGSAHTTAPLGTPEPAPNAVGSMAISPNGQRVAVAVYGSSFAELFDFNRWTGKLSNAAHLPLPIPGSDGSVGCYGVAFSATSQHLYVSRYFYNFSTDLTQYSLKVPRALVESTAVRLPGIGTGIQLAPNGRIYGLNPADDALSVIEQPDATGPACTVRRRTIPLLRPATGRLGITNFPILIPAIPDVSLISENIPFPNIITPDGDGYNDGLRPTESIEGITGTLRIYSRWGELLFTTNDLQTGWDGNGAGEGTYFYELTYRLFNESVTAAPRRLRGWIEVVR